METWWIGANGSVQDAYCYEGGQWQRFELAPGGSVATDGGIMAVSRIPTAWDMVDWGRWFGPACLLVRRRLGSGSSSWRGVVLRLMARSLQYRASPTVWRCGGLEPMAPYRMPYWYEGGQWQRFELAPGVARQPRRDHGSVTRPQQYGSMVGWSEWLRARCLLVRRVAMATVRVSAFGECFD